MLLYRINIDFNILDKKEQILGTGQKRANFGQKGYFLGTQKIFDKKEQILDKKTIMRKLIIIIIDQTVRSEQQCGFMVF